MITRPSNSPAEAFSASSASTGMQGSPAPWASPLAVAMPMRTPVKLPGPVTAAIASSA